MKNLVGAFALLGAVMTADSSTRTFASRNGDVNGDRAIDLSDTVYLLEFLFRGGPAPVPCVLPDTGQTKCHDATGAVKDCASAVCPGQDGLYGSGCGPEGRFADNGDGTVTDTCTGLIWQQDTAPKMAWCDALDYCANLVLAGRDDWRLPNVRELASLIDYGRVMPAIDPLFNAESAGYWSSTSNTLLPVHAWYVLFLDGDVADFDKGLKWHVRAVRGP